MVNLNLLIITLVLVQLFRHEQNDSRKGNKILARKKRKVRDTEVVSQVKDALQESDCAIILMKFKGLLRDYNRVEERWERRMEEKRWQ